MRTTIDPPDSLFHRAKQVALERQMTLKTFIAKAVQRELNAAQPVASRMSRPPISLEAVPFAPALSNAKVAELMD